MNLFRKRAEKEKEKQKKAELISLLEDIRQVEAEISENETLFNLVTDETLIESLIYERNAKTARLRYLLKLAKELKTENHSEDEIAASQLCCSSQ